MGLLFNSVNQYSSNIYEIARGVLRSRNHQARLVEEQAHEISQLRQQPLTLPSDIPLPHHTYGPKMISLCLNLSQQIGFRPTATALQTVFDWLGIETKIPSWDAIRIWLMRAGVSQLQQPVGIRSDA